MRLRASTQMKRSSREILKHSWPHIEWWSKCHIDSGSLIHDRPISLSLSTASLEVRSDAE